MLKRLAVVLVLLGSLVFAAGASAHSRDRNGDRLPDRWEKKHDLSLKLHQTRRDQDKDGFDNLAEWRSHTDPRDEDSDDDGLMDDEENAGKVSKIEGDVLTITLFDGGELSATLTDATEVECDDDAGASASSDDPSGDDEHGDDEQGDDEHGDHDGDHEHGDDDGDHDDRDDDHGDDACPAGALAVGANVKEAELKATSAGRVWDKIELR